MGKSFLGCTVAMLSGWIVANLDLYYFSGQPSHNLGGAFVGTAFLIVTICGVVFWPLYLQVPRDNFLWNPLVCVPLGALAGSLFLLVFGGPGWLVFTDYAIKGSIPGAIVGATIWLVATSTYSWFHSDSDSPPSTAEKLPSIWRWLFIISITSQVTLRAIFSIKEDSHSFFDHWAQWDHPIRAGVVYCILVSAGLFLLVYTPRFFYRLGYFAMLAWIAAVVTCGDFFAFVFGAHFS